MLRPIAIAAALMIALPHAARAQWSDDQPPTPTDNPNAGDDDGRWADGQWSGDDEFSEMDGPPSAGDPADGYAPPNGPGSRDLSAQAPSEPPPPPEYGAPPPNPELAEAAAVQQAGPSINDFRSGLSGYGRWVQTPEYGMVWQPEAVSSGWRPYWDGHWVYSSAGWTWMTDEPWGWATYHYGRWAYLGGPRGWVWLPGRVWAPAWVSWRWGDGVAGWCPLGPRGVVYAEPHYWLFVRSSRFLEPVRRVALPYTQARVWYGRARPMPIYRPGPRWGPPTRVIEVATHRPIHAVPIVEAHRPGVRAVAGGIQVFRPHTQPIIYRHDVVQPQRGLRPAVQPDRGVRPIVQPVARPTGAPRPMDDHRPQPMIAPREFGDHRPQPQPARDAAPAHSDSGPRTAPAEWGGPMREGPSRRADPARPATPARPADKEPARPATPAEPHAQRPAERTQPAAPAHVERAQPVVARFESHGGAAPRPAATQHAAPTARPVEKKKQ